MLTALSNESGAMEVKVERRAIPLAEPLDAGWLMGTAGSLKGAKQGEEQKKVREKRIT
jgi:hypothetical protein